MLYPIKHFSMDDVNKEIEMWTRIMWRYRAEWIRTGNPVYRTYMENTLHTLTWWEGVRYTWLDDLVDL